MLSSWALPPRWVGGRDSDELGLHITHLVLHFCELHGCLRTYFVELLLRVLAGVLQGRGDLQKVGLHLDVARGHLCEDLLLQRHVVFDLQYLLGNGLEVGLDRVSLRRFDSVEVVHVVVVSGDHFFDAVYALHDLIRDEVFLEYLALLVDRPAFFEGEGLASVCLFINTAFDLYHACGGI